ncbi:MAG: hypothetical protein BroJett030_00010 [Alphaproteobacteria bacterium]|nr:MAG: hypothetical protein BroJett030_00010 [Alphaproteobacteria bacterium]
MLRWLHRTELALRGLAVPPPAVFLHVFKTGGTSIANWLYQHYPVSAPRPTRGPFAARLPATMRH